MKTKLIQSIKAKQTGNRAYSDSNFIGVAVSYKEPEDYSYLQPMMAKEYYVGVNLGAAVYVDEDKHEGERLHMATKEIGRMICKEVYGELHEELLRLRYELYKQGHFRDTASIESINKMLGMIEYD